MKRDLINAVGRDLGSGWLLVLCAWGGAWRAPNQTKWARPGLVRPRGGARLGPRGWLARIAAPIGRRQKLEPLAWWDCGAAPLPLRPAGRIAYANLIYK